MNPNLKTYYSLLLKWQKTINLIAPGTVEDAWERHFEDSLQLLDYIPEGTKAICDLGSGAGFPGLVIALERSDIQVHLVESDTRKCAFLKNVSRETKAENIIIHNVRIEKAMPHIEADLITARALASLKELIQYAQPLWTKNPNLQMLLPKGKSWKEEIIEAQADYSFIADEHPSKTSSEARILLVGNIVQK